MPMISFGGAKHDVWLSAIIATVLGLAGTWLILKLGQKYPSQTIIEYSQQILGKALGKTVGMLFISFFILVAAISARDFSELYLIHVMPQVPLYIFVIIILIVAAYALRHGIKVVGRTAEVFVPLIILVIIIGVSGNILNLQYTPSLPLEDGWHLTIKDGLTELPFLGIGFFWLFLLPLLEPKQRAGKTLFLSIAVVGLILLVVSTTIIAVIGPSIPPTLNYQFFFIFQQIKIGYYIQRIDLLLLVGWTSSSYIAITLCYYIAVFASKQLLGPKAERYLVPIIGIIIFMISVLGFSSYMNLRRFFALDNFGLIALPIEFGIPLLILIVGYVRSRINSAGKKQYTQAQQT